MNRLWIRFLMSYLAVVLLAVAGSSLLVARQMRAHFLQELEQDLYRSARMLSTTLPAESPARAASGEALDGLCRKLREATGYRFTVVSGDGRVLGDSDEASQSMENHLYRPEIRAALEQGRGSSVRFSHTLKEPMLYAAVLDSVGGEPVVVRLSLPARAVETNLSAIRSSILLWGAVGFLLAFPFLYLFSRSVSGRIVRLKSFLEGLRRGDRSKRLHVRSGDELGELERELDEVAGELAGHVEGLTAERKRRGIILRAIRDGIVLLDDQERVLFINPAAAGIFGVDPDLSRGQRLLEVVRSEDLYRVVRNAGKESGSPPEPSEVMILKAPDRTFLASAVALVEPADSGSIGCLVVLRDITQEKRLERIRADFVSHVSHELRTPLTLIKGFVETLREEGTGDPERASRYLSIVGENTDRLVRLVEDLLRLSSIEMGRIPIRRQPVRVEEIVEKACQTVAPRIREKKLALVLSIQKDIPAVAADPDRLVEILLNLVDNAVKYTQSGEIRVAAECRLRPQVLPPQVAVTVSDTGIGIPARELPRVTERFYRGERGDHKDVRGSGLGLAIVKHLVRAMDGEVSISSKEDAGTTVTVVLPVWAGQGEEGAQEE